MMNGGIGKRGDGLWVIGGGASAPSRAEWASTIEWLRGPACEVCGCDTRAFGGRAHHVFPRETHPEWELETWNGRWLCENCHFGIHDSRLNTIWQAELVDRGCPEDGWPYLQPQIQVAMARMRVAAQYLWLDSPDEAMAQARAEWLQEISAGLLTGLGADVRDALKRRLEGE